jgi:NAD(P)-dependent dehydrogenase (short-subunit alcohol dehydrogenase family)
VLLEGKVAVVYGAGGRIGGAVARGFAREGAEVFLAGRTRDPLEAVAEEIRRAGGTARVETLDALDERGVDAFADRIAERSGRLDVSFNLISYGEVRRPLNEIWVEDFTQPVLTAMRTHFLTTRAAARHMVPRGSGVILALGGSNGATRPGRGGFQVALDAVEGLRRQWACELGPHGVRFVTLKCAGAPGTFASDADEPPLLRRTPTLTEIADVASFVASDKARTMTAATVNVSCGAIMDQ